MTINHSHKIIHSIINFKPGEGTKMKKSKEVEVQIYKLSVQNRLSFLELMNNIGDSTTLKIIRELREELSFSEVEHALLKFQRLPGGMTKWDDNVEPREFEFSGIREIILEEIKTKLKEEEKNEVLKLNLLPLYEVFIEGKES